MQAIHQHLIVVGSMFNQPKALGSWQHQLHSLGFNTMLPTIPLHQISAKKLTTITSNCFHMLHFLGCLIDRVALLKGGNLGLDPYGFGIQPFKSNSVRKEGDK